MADVAANSPEGQSKEVLPQAQSNQNLMADLYAGMTEATLFKSPLVADSFKPPFNPDDLWQKKGDYSVYEKMCQDDQVSVCLRLKKDLILGDGGQFTPGDDNQDEIIDDLKAAFFDEYSGDFSNDLEEILTGYEFGFSLTEKVFKLRTDGNLGIKYLRTRHPNSWRLHQDIKGNVEKYEQITVDGSLTINPKSVIHFINDPKFQNPYGYSDLRSAYNAWFTKTQVVRFFAIFLEKAASPIPYAAFDKNAPQSAVDKLFEILKSFQTKTALVVPKDIELKFLEARNSSGDAYTKAIHLFNMFIGRALFIPDLLGFTGSETAGGSLALGKEQMNLFFMHIMRRREHLEGIINKELVKPIVTYNFGDIPNPPKFRFKPLDDMQAVDLAKVWLDAVKGKAYEANDEEINHFRKLVKFPEGEVNRPDAGDPMLHPAVQQALGGHPMAPVGPDGKPYTPDKNNPLNPNKEGDDNKDPQDPAAKSGKLVSEKEITSKGGDPADKSGSLPPDKKNFGKFYNLPPGNYCKKVDFKSIENKLKDYDASLLNDVKPIVKKIMIDLKDQIQRKNILKSQDVSRIDGLSLKYKKELKQVIKNSFMQLFKDAQSQAASELDKSNFAKPLTNEEFLAAIEAETFQYVGDYEYAILKRVRVELIAAIKDGRPLSSVLDVLDTDLKDLSEASLERYARTKHTEVMNNARVEYFDSTGVVAAYQYSAVLDDRTSDICAGLDGKIFEAGSEPIPPMHFNCRSVLIPITKYEDYKPTETIKGQSVDDFIEENKGTGFSTK